VRQANEAAGNQAPGAAGLSPEEFAKLADRLQADTGQALPNLNHLANVRQWEAGNCSGIDPRQQPIEYYKADQELKPWLGSPPAPWRAQGRPEDEGPSVRLVEEVIEVRFQGKTKPYWRKANLALSWLVGLLGKPYHAFTVAELRGDPEGKIAIDSARTTVRGEERNDILDRLAPLYKELNEVQEEGDRDGWTDALTVRKSELLESVKTAGAAEMECHLKRKHSTVAKQLRTLVRKKLAGFPALAAHLGAHLDMEFPHFVYKPPEGLRWKIEKS